MRFKCSVVVHSVVCFVLLIVFWRHTPSFTSPLVRRVNKAGPTQRNSSHSLNGTFETFPHLNKIEDLVPRFLLGSPRKKKLVIAIPVVERANGFYLIKTLQSLTKWINETESDSLSIMIFVRSSNEFAERVANEVTTILGPWKSSAGSILQVLQMPHHLHPPNLDKITPNFNDSLEKMLWRTRQNIDFMYMMSYGSQFGRYYMQLEDDVVAQKDFLKNILFSIRAHADKTWMMMEFAMEGFICKMFKSDDARAFAQYVSLFYRVKPVDWLLADFLRAHFCSPERGNSCPQDIAAHVVRYLPSLFNHIGTQSSLPGKIQSMKETGFSGRSRSVKKSPLPPAHVTTNMVRRRGGEATAAALWSFPVFFHANQPGRGDTIQVNFHQTTRLQAILITSGTYLRTEAVFDSSVEVVTRLAAEWTVLGQFDRDGRFEKMLDCQEMDELAIRVTEDAASDVLLTNIFIVSC